MNKKTIITTSLLSIVFFNRFILGDIMKKKILNFIFHYCLFCQQCFFCVACSNRSNLADCGNGGSGSGGRRMTYIVNFIEKNGWKIQ